MNFQEAAGRSYHIGYSEFRRRGELPSYHRLAYLYKYVLQCLDNAIATTKDFATTPSTVVAVKGSEMLDMVFAAWAAD